MLFICAIYMCYLYVLFTYVICIYMSYIYIKCHIYISYCIYIYIHMQHGITMDVCPPCWRYNKPTIPKGQKKGVWSGSKSEDFMDDNSIVYCKNGNYILFMANNMKSLEYS